IFVTTTIAPAAATVSCMIFTWLRYGKPDVSMCLNASLAGLVGITAGCDVTDALGSLIIGTVSGLLVVFGVWLLDYRLRVDDPVGAVAVHCLNGIWGTLAVGLLASPSAPGYSIADASGAPMAGLFYGGGFKLMGIQLLGFGSVALWTVLTMIPVFLGIRKLFGLRASREDEVTGLDISEHGLVSAYAGFAMTPEYLGETVPVFEPDAVADMPEAEPAVTVPAKTPAHGSRKLTRIDIVCRESKVEALKNALVSIGITGMTITHVLGCGAQKGRPEYYRGVQVEANLLPKVQFSIVVAKVPVRTVIETAKKVLHTGHIGDGKIFVYDVENVIKVRTSEEGYDALQDVE
ncbi:MAG: adenylate cyclase, partial [Solobacterium sp.]|nr:adenylate cyclase [Solobacterium sp.]